MVPEYSNHGSTNPAVQVRLKRRGNPRRKPAPTNREALSTLFRRWIEHFRVHDAVVGPVRMGLKHPEVLLAAGPTLQARQWGVAVAVKIVSPTLRRAKEVKTLRTKTGHQPQQEGA
jgi:hypothetical protein